MSDENVIIVDKTMVREEIKKVMEELNKSHSGLERRIEELETAIHDRTTIGGIFVNKVVEDWFKDEDLDLTPLAREIAQLKDARQRDKENITQLWKTVNCDTRNIMRLESVLTKLVGELHFKEKNKKQIVYIPFVKPYDWKNRLLEELSGEKELGVDITNKDYVVPKKAVKRSDSKPESKCERECKNIGYCPYKDIERGGIPSWCPIEKPECSICRIPIKAQCIEQELGLCRIDTVKIICKSCGFPYSYKLYPPGEDTQFTGVYKCFSCKYEFSLDEKPERHPKEVCVKSGYELICDGDCSDCPDDKREKPENHCDTCTFLEKDFCRFHNEKILDPQNDSCYDWEPKREKPEEPNDFYILKSEQPNYIPSDIDVFFREYPSDIVRIKYERLLEALRIHDKEVNQKVIEDIKEIISWSKNELSSGSETNIRLQRKKDKWDAKIK